MSRKPRQLLLLATLTLAGALGSVGASLVLDSADSATAGSEPAAALPVETRAVTPQAGFARKRLFSGWVQARRESVLGFELGGRLARVLVDEGASVEPGQLLAELDSERLAAQRAELLAGRAEAEAKLRLANVTLKRLRGVVENGGVSRQSLDEALETQRAARAALDLAEQRIATIDIEREKTRLSAPFAAVVIARAADEGRVLEAGHPILTLQERAIPEIRIGIAGRSLDQLEPGRVYPLLWRGATVSARLRALLPVRAATARTVDALFEPLDPPAGMLPGDTVRLVLESYVAQRGGWLPLGAMAEGERGLWSVYVAEPLADPDDGLGATHKVVRRTVEVIHQTTDRVFVEGAFSPDERIVVTGLQRIVPGQSVRLARASVNLAGSEHE